MFLMPLRRDPWPKGKHASRPCPVCGEDWIPWADSKLPCHAKCLFTDDAVEAISRDPRTEAVIARTYGVTLAVIRAARSKAREFDL